MAVVPVDVGLLVGSTVTEVLLFVLVLLGVLVVVLVVVVPVSDGGVVDVVDVVEESAGGASTAGGVSLSNGESTAGGVSAAKAMPLAVRIAMSAEITSSFLIFDLFIRVLALRFCTDYLASPKYNGSPSSYIFSLSMLFSYMKVDCLMV